MTTSKITQIYREAAIQGASNVELVIIMYDMLLEDLASMIDAIKRQDIEARSNETKHALLVLQQLQGSLNMQEGGESASTMDRLYSVTRGKLIEANIKNSIGILREMIETFSDLKKAWQQVDSSTPAQQKPESIPPTLLPDSSHLSAEQVVTRDWTA